MILPPPEGVEQDVSAREKALAALRDIAAHADDLCDREADHQNADRILLDLIGDAEITAAFASIRKWYA